MTVTTAIFDHIESTLDDPGEQEAALPGRLIGHAAINAYVTAGNATVTFRALATGNRFTYRVRASKNDASFLFVSLLTGPDNTANYAYIGYIRRGVFFHGGAKAHAGADAQSVKAFAWVWQRVMSEQDLSSTVEVFHEGRCGRCGRKLTTPESVERGLGPECAGKV